MTHWQFPLNVLLVRLNESTPWNLRGNQFATVKCCALGMGDSETYIEHAGIMRLRCNAKTRFWDYWLSDTSHSVSLSLLPGQQQLGVWSTSRARGFIEVNLITASAQLSHDNPYSTLNSTSENWNDVNTSKNFPEMQTWTRKIMSGSLFCSKTKQRKQERNYAAATLFGLNWKHEFGQHSVTFHYTWDWPIKP